MNSVPQMIAFPSWLPSNLVSCDRAKGLGGSDIAAIVGLSKWATPFDIWLDKKGNAPKQEEEQWQSWGNKLEPFIASAYSDKTQQKIVKCGVTLANEERPWQLGSPDYLCVDKPSGIDCKNIRIKSSEWGEEGTDLIPSYYLIQVQYYMTLLGIPVYDLPVLFGGSQFEIFTIENNEKLGASLLEKAEEFWKTYIIGDKRPEIEDSPRVRNWIKSQFPKHIRPLRAATAHEDTLAHELHQVKTVLASVEKEKADLEAKLKLSIADGEGLDLYDGKVTYRANKNGEKTDWEAVSRDACDALIKVQPDLLPILLDKHTKSTQGARVLRLNINKESE